MVDAVYSVAEGVRLGFRALALTCIALGGSGGVVCRRVCACRGLDCGAVVVRGCCCACKEGSGGLVDMSCVVGINVDESWLSCIITAHSRSPAPWLSCCPAGTVLCSGFASVPECVLLAACAPCVSAQRRGSQCTVLLVASIPSQREGLAA